jgi:EAL domain-containing protein (putative c-di-GMP-specific phosphodiesterase class I)
MAERQGGERIEMCSINLSGASLGDERSLEYVREQFADFQIPHSMICFEITETDMIRNFSEAQHFIQELKALGCRFSLDDFGSGMSSFAYLKHFPVDFLKIDGEFVKDMLDDPMDKATVVAFHSIGKAMGKQTIAEFVENDAILKALRVIGVDYVQGYGVARPRPFCEEMPACDCRSVCARKRTTENAAVVLHSNRAAASG